MIIPFVKIRTVPTDALFISPKEYYLHDPFKYTFGEVLETYNLPPKRFLEIGELILVEHCLDREIGIDKIGIAGFLNYEKNFFLFMVEGE